MIFNRTLLALGFAIAAVVSAPLTASAQTAPDYNYIGMGGGDDGFIINGKITLSDHLSLRPILGTDFDFNDGDDVNYTLPITYDFNALDSQGSLFPFIGAGIDGQIGDNSDIEFAVTAGTDYRINENFLINGSIVWTPFADGSDDVGFTAGIGYSF